MILPRSVSGRSASACVESAGASCLISAVGGWAWRFLSGSTKRWLVKEVLRFVLWLLAGLVIYFAYSIHHSKLARGPVAAAASG